MSSSVRDTFIRVAILLRRHADLEGVGKLALQPQGRDQRTQIGVAAALAEPVQRALDLARAGAHRGQRIGHRLLGVVMGVDADVIAGDVLCHLGDDGLDLVRHGAAIGVAQHHPARAGIVGRFGAGQREFRVFLVAVEEMLAVEHDLAAGGFAAFTLSRIEARFSSLVVSSATRTW